MPIRSRTFHLGSLSEREREAVITDTLTVDRALYRSGQDAIERWATSLGDRDVQVTHYVDRGRVVAYLMIMTVEHVWDGEPVTIVRSRAGALPEAAGSRAPLALARGLMELHMKMLGLTNASRRDGIYLYDSGSVWNGRHDSAKSDVHSRFFERENPGYRDGTAMVVVIELSLRNLLRGAARVARQRFDRRLGEQPSNTVCADTDPSMKRDA